MKYIKSRPQFKLNESSFGIKIDTSKSPEELTKEFLGRNRHEDVDKLLRHLLRKGRKDLAKKVFIGMNDYWEFELDFVFDEADLEFLEFAFDNRPHIFLTKKSKYYGGYDIGNARNGFNLLRVGSKHSKQIIDDLFKHDFHKAIIELAEFSIKHNLPKVFDNILSRFGKDNDLTKIYSGDRKTIKYNMELIDEITRKSELMEKNWNMSFADVLIKYPHLTDNLTNANKATLVRNTPYEYKQKVGQAILGRPFKPNEFWRAYIYNPEWFKVEEIKRYVQYIKALQKDKKTLPGIKNVLKIKQQLLKKEFIEMLRDEGVLGYIAEDIGYLYMHSLKFVGMFNREKDKADALYLLKLLKESNPKIDNEWLAIKLAQNVSDLEIVDHTSYEDEENQESGFDRMIRQAFDERMYTGGHKVIDVGEDGIKEIHNLFAYLMGFDAEDILSAKMAYQKLKKPMEDMDEKELKDLMDKALDRKDFDMAKKIGDHLKKFL